MVQGDHELVEGDVLQVRPAPGPPPRRGQGVGDVKFTVLDGGCVGPVPVHPLQTASGPAAEQDFDYPYNAAIKSHELADDQRREAYTRCHKILGTDAPQLGRERSPAFEALLGDLGLRAPADIASRAEVAIAFLPTLWDATEAILAANLHPDT